MQHLDDGQIAELIDSASGPPGGAVDEHLRACAVCRERVQDARAIAARAKAILGAAVPGGSAGSVVPPFEEVLHRAGRARTRRVRMGATRWLAWAATLVIAGGVGWVARDQLGFPRNTFRPATSSLESAARAPETPTATGQTSPVALADRAMPVEEQKPHVANEGKVGAPATPPPPPALAVGGAEARQESTATDRLVAGRREDQAAVAAPPPVAQNMAAPNRERLDAHRALVEPEAPAMAKTAANVADAIDAREWVPATRETAERALGGPIVTVEGLRVVSYALRLAGGVQVRTVQSLGAGIELELRQSAAPPARGAVTPAPGGAGAAGIAEMHVTAAAPATDTIAINGFRIVGRAPISVDSLRALLKRIK
jgi:hypothetical protein